MKKKYVLITLNFLCEIEMCRALDFMPYASWLFRGDARAEQLSIALQGADVLNKKKRRKRFDGYEENRCRPMVTCLNYKK